MKSKFKSKYLPFWAAALGGLALLLRLGFSLLGRDDKGLLMSGHPLNILVWGCTAAAALLVFLSVWPLDGSCRYGDNFSPSTPAAIGAFALAGGIAVSVISGWNFYSRLELIRGICGLVAIPALILAALIRWQGKRPNFLFHAVVCVYLTLFAVSHYPVWSSRPQLQDYIFSTAASLLLALFAYYQTAFDVGMGKRRMQLGSGLLAAFFCLAAVAGGEDVLFYLGGAAWTLTNLCSLFPVPRRRKNPISDGAKEENHESA